MKNGFRPTVIASATRTLRAPGSERRSAAKRLGTLIALLAVLLQAGMPQIARAADGDVRTVRLTSLEWPPYSGKDLPEQGASVAVVRAALAAMGHALQVDFVPWTRAVALGQDSQSGYHGYFPEYASPEVERAFSLSAPIGRSPLGLVERASSPVAWKVLDDLTGMKIGVVRGYVNTIEFDARVARGDLKAVPASDDLANVRKVMTGRLPLAVIDRHVLAYLMANERGAADARRVLRFNSRLLEDKPLYVALQRNEDGEWVRQTINAGLLKIDAGALAAPFFE